jgi:hypothetical protein
MIFYPRSDSVFTRTYSEEAKMAFSSLDCILSREKVIYAGAELTTGLRLYRALREFRVKTAAELKQLKGAEWYGEHLWDPNVTAAKEFAAHIRAEVGKEHVVVTPAFFSAPGWKQPEYLSFWEELLRTRIHASWFKADWQYSNGCTLEFAVSTDAGLSTHDHHGQPLSVRQAIELIRAAIRDLESSGFDTATLHKNLARLRPSTAGV